MDRSSERLKLPKKAKPSPEAYNSNSQQAQRANQQANQPTSQQASRSGNNHQA